MPRNGSGGYTPPQNSWNPAINGMGALPDDWMAILNDLAAAMQASIAADGQTPITGSLNFGNNRLRNVGAPQGQGDGLRFEQMMKGADIASAATIAFPIEGALFDVTGTTTITGISGSFPGRGVLVRFMDALTLTNGTNLILPGGADITTQAGDFAAFVCLDGTKWQCWLYPARSERLVSSDYFGPTAPSTTWPGMTWADSGTSTLWRRDAANAAWINEGVLFQRAVPGMTAAQIAALTADQGPIIVTDHGGAVYVWDGTKYAPLIADETYAGAMKRTTTALAQALADDATALTPKKLADAFKGANQSLAANGYRKDPGGLILQWGNSGVVNGSTNATITLPITFPNAGLFGLASGYNTTNVNNGAPIVMSVSTTTIVVRNSNGTTSVPGIFWMALGY